MTRSEIKKNEHLQKRKRIKKEIFSHIRDIFIIVGLCLIIKTYIIDVSLVSGHSMEPNIKDKQLIIVKKWDTHIGEKGKGINFYDIVVLENVEFEGLKKPLSIVKRVIGLPGDHIEIIDGEIYRNEKKLQEPLIMENAEQINQAFDIKKDEVFVVGDNRNHSTDSRHIGPQPIGKVTGEVVTNFDAEWISSFAKKARDILQLEEPI